LRHPLPHAAGGLPRRQLNQNWVAGVSTTPGSFRYAAAERILNFAIADPICKCRPSPTIVVAKWKYLRIRNPLQAS
jgi:hypothetical protein